MKFYKVREALLEGKNISALPLRVTFYARVSTESDEQLNSLSNQISYFKDYISSNKTWTFIEGYIDEGLSGSTVNKRKNFLKMIEDAKKGLFDLIITKEVSRFSRNLSDSIKYTQELMSNDVGVLFQSNAINTYDPNSEFILNMMGSVAQEEIKRLSARIKWGHKEAIKKGRVLGSSSITGYKKENAKLVIVEKEAKLVRKIYELYVTERYGLTKLGLKLHELGYNNSKGKIYDKDTLKRIIQNPKYKGYYSGHTTEIIDYRTKKRINIPKKDRVIYKDDNIPAIVSEELWERANQILNKRSNIVKNKDLSIKRINQKSAYTGKIFCYNHNVNFQKISKKNPSKTKWACSNYIKYRLKSCSSPIIKEIDLNSIINTIMNRIFNNKTIITNQMISYYNSLKINNTYEEKLRNIHNSILDINQKKEKILELNITGNLSNNEFKERNELYNKEKIELEKDYQKIAIDNERFNQNNSIDIIKTSIKKELNFKNITEKMVNRFIDEIIVSKIDNNRNNLKLDIILNLTNKSLGATKKSKYLNNLNNYLPVLTFNHKSNPSKKNTKYKINVYLNS